MSLLDDYDALDCPTLRRPRPIGANDVLRHITSGRLYLVVALEEPRVVLVHLYWGRASRH